MLPAPAFVISDAHLGFATKDSERALLGFFRYLLREHEAGRASSLLINGDLFEFWFEWKHVMPRGAFRVLAGLADLRDAGLPVVMIAGNHDCWGGEILKDDVGIDFRFGPWEDSLGGWRAWVEHGDGLRAREDRRYRALRSVLRNRLAISMFRLLHPDAASALANRSSHASRVYQARDGGAGLRQVASDRLAEKPNVDLVIFGHSHFPELARLGSGVYANAGPWLDQQTYLRINPDRIELRRWVGGRDASDESVHLNALDRVTEKTLA